MTAYLLTEAKHAQLVDALTDGRDWAEDALKDYNDKYEDHPACEGGRKIIADSLERLTAALAMLKAMKPSTPVAHLVYDPGACSQDLYFEEELGDMDGNSIESR